jgi:hypothetical protein
MLLIYHPNTDSSTVAWVFRPSEAFDPRHRIAVNDAVLIGRRASVAVADGATETFSSKVGVKLLVEAYCARQLKESELRLIFHGTH